MAAVPILDRYPALLTAAYWVVTVIGAIWCFLIVYGVVGYGLCGNTGTVPCDAYSYWAVDSTPYTWETNLEYRYSPPSCGSSAVPGPAVRGLPRHLDGGAHRRPDLAARRLVPDRARPERGRPARQHQHVHRAVRGARHPALGGLVGAGAAHEDHAGGRAWCGTLVRREWRQLALARRGHARRSCASACSSIPSLWRAWLDTLLKRRPDLRARPPARAAAGCGSASGRRSWRPARWTGRAWLVPIAMLVAVPGLWAFNSRLLAAIPGSCDASHPRAPRLERSGPATRLISDGRRIPARRRGHRLDRDPDRLRLRLHLLLPAGRGARAHRSVDALRLVGHLHLQIHADRRAAFAPLVPLCEDAAAWAWLDLQARRAGR